MVKTMNTFIYYFEHLRGLTDVNKVYLLTENAGHKAKYVKMLQD